MSIAISQGSLAMRLFAMRLLLTLIILTSLSADAALAVEKSAAYWYEEGQKLLENKSYEEAIVSFDRSIGEDHRNWNAWYGKGKALYGLEKYDDGLDLCNQVLDSLKDQPGNIRARFLNLDGIFCTAYENKYSVPPTKGDSYCSGDIPKMYLSALERYDEALKLDSNLISAWNSKGIALGSLCQMDGSIESFDKAMLLNSTLAEVWNNKGVSLDWMGKHNESMACYNRAIELKPDLAVAWMNRARTLSLNLSLFSLAQQNASIAIELDPSLENELTRMTWS
ncbi:Tetratricopeptide repeat protein [uncultured archaeon]|nr:Tetratricopeptide repeat protein [uncultured archaeon]